MEVINFENTPRSTYFDQPPSERLLAEAEEIRTAAVTESNKVGYSLLNKHLLGEERPVVAVGGFMSDLTTPVRVWEGLHLASLNRPILMLDLPGHGFSSPHTFRQTYDLCVRRSLESQAEPMTEAVQGLLEPGDPIDYFGISHGGLVALKMTEQDPQDRVETVFGIDLPAVKRRWTLEMQFGYLLVDNLLGRRKYLRTPALGTQISDFEAFSRSYSARSENSRAEGFIKNDPLLFLSNLFASVDARPIALEAWGRIMADKTTAVHVVTAERSSVSDHEAIESFINSLDADARARSRQTVVPGENHNIGLAYLMPRSLEWARKAYEC